MSVIDQLSSELARLPGIGPKTALRLVHYLMKGSKHDIHNLVPERVCFDSDDQRRRPQLQ